MRFPEWQPGAKWIPKDKTSICQVAIIVGPGKDSRHKEVWMSFTSFRSQKAVVQNYSHNHMRKYFEFTDETGTIDHSKELI